MARLGERLLWLVVPLEIDGTPHHEYSGTVFPFLTWARGYDQACTQWLKAHEMGETHHVNKSLKKNGAFRLSSYQIVDYQGIGEVSWNASEYHEDRRNNNGSLGYGGLGVRFEDCIVDDKPMPRTKITRYGD